MLIKIDAMPKIVDFFEFIAVGWGVEGEGRNDVRSVTLIG